MYVWILVPECQQIHEYGEDGWRPALHGLHEHRISSLQLALDRRG